jgi:hypothetical protein
VFNATRGCAFYRTVGRGVLGLVTLGLVAGGAGRAVAAVGQLRVLQGEASITRGQQVIVVRQAATLEDGDKVQTQAGSRAHIRLSPDVGGGEALVQEYTIVQVNDLRGANKTAPLVLAIGSLRTRVSRWLRPESYVLTATATIGIKGTDFITWVKKPNATEFIGVDGLIDCVSRSRPEYSIQIGPKRWGEIVEGQKPNPPIEVPDALWASALRDYAFPEN